MTLSSASSPDTASRRLRRGALALVLSLLVLELAVRFPPLNAALSSALDPYERLLWYYPAMPAYQAQLRSSHYDLWLVGSSYLATALEPQQVQARLEAGGLSVSVQNYGFSLMQNLADMSLVMARWMLTLDKPRYALIGLHWGNFGWNGARPARARSSPMERATIFRDTLEDSLGGLMYASSALFRYAALARNAFIVPREKTDLQDMPLGGYVANKETYQCDETLWTQENRVTPEDMTGHLARLDALIDVLQKNGVRVAVVSIPYQYCALRRSYSDTESYIALYLEPVAAHLAARGIPYAEFDRRFYAAFPSGEEQASYYNDPSHPNEKGAVILSAWAGEFAAEWLRSPQP